LHELFVGGEGLARGGVELVGTLLHEAAHGIAQTRGIQDTSRQGRYHNSKFREIGEEVGLELTRHEVIGWSLTTVPPATARAYGAQVAVLEAALVVHRVAEHHATTPGPNGPGGLDGATGDGPGDAGRRRGSVAAVCGCPRRIRVAPSVLDAGPITCGVCNELFETHQ
ncbi:MAG: hypothetical protein ACRCY9_01295, partial [Phycicoccus sp.]